MTFFNNEMKSRGKIGWLLMDNSSTHGLPADAVPHIWEEDGLRLRGFKMSNTNAVYLPANTTSHIQPLDGGIIVNFKGRFKRLFIRWIITVLDSGVARDSEKARPNMYQAIQWARTAWDEVSADTIKNCWNKVKILPAPVLVTGGGTRDDVFDELQALLVSMGDECDTLTFVDQPDERWTEAPIESDEEDAELVAALKARSEQDEEEDDDSPAVIPWTLSQARAASDGMKTFFHANQAEHPELRKYMEAVEGIEKLLENMTFSARSKQTTLLQHDFTAGPAAAQPGSADRP
jgi:hypothetical protein